MVQRRFRCTYPGCCKAAGRAVLFGLFMVAFSMRALASMTPAPVPGLVVAVGIESQYADVIRQVGGRYVEVSAIEIDPNTDPHMFEVSPKIVRRIAAAELIVENGLGYDAWAAKLIAAMPDPDRQVINVQHLLGVPDSTANPHFWYDPKTMPAVAEALATALAALQPAHAAYFRANAKAFDRSLKPWYAAIARFRADYVNVAVAVTEPVANDLLDALGMKIETPVGLQAAIMNGIDPAPQDIAAQTALLRGHKVRVFVYNRQVTDPLTRMFLSLARSSGVPVVGVYETMPTPGYTYQSWMLAETDALQKAVAGNTSVQSTTEMGRY